MTLLTIVNDILAAFDAKPIFIMTAGFISSF